MAEKRITLSIHAHGETCLSGCDFYERPFGGMSQCRLFGVVGGKRAPGCLSAEKREVSDNTDDPHADAFETATYYECLDEPELSHKTVAEALGAAHDDAWLDETGTSAMLIAKIAPVEVTAHTRKVVTDEHVETFTDAAWDALEESADEAFGNPARDDTLWTETHAAGIRFALRLAIRRGMDSASIWRCDVVGTRSYTADEIAAILTGDESYPNPNLRPHLAGRAADIERCTAEYIAENIDASVDGAIVHVCDELHCDGVSVAAAWAKLVFDNPARRWSVIDPNSYIRHMLECAAKSPCSRDKRGALVVRDGEILGRGFNAPVGGSCTDAVCCQKQMAWVGREKPLERIRSCGGHVEHAEAMAIRTALPRKISDDWRSDPDTFDDMLEEGEYTRPLNGCELVHLNTDRCKDRLHQHGNENAFALPPCQYCAGTGRVRRPSRRGKACPTCAIPALNLGISGIWLYHARLDGDGAEWVRYTMIEYGREAGVLA